MIGELKSGELNFIEMRHDAGCPSTETQSASDCTCNPEFALVTEKKWLAGVKKTRMERRKAKRQADKAIRKAKVAT